MNRSARARTRPGVSFAAVVGVAVLLFGPVIAPFTTISLGVANESDVVGQQFTALDANGQPIVRDAWSLTSSFFTATNADVRAAQQYALETLLARGLDESEFQCLVKLWQRESHWNYRSHNSNTGAYGIPQAMPGKKMASEGADWETNPETQINWGLKYIYRRYDTPCKAWQHSQNSGWY